MAQDSSGRLRTASGCLARLAAPPPALGGAGLSAKAVKAEGTAQTSLVRSRGWPPLVVVGAQEEPGANRGLGEPPALPGDDSSSSCSQLSSPLAGKDSVFPLPVHTFLRGRRKRSWLPGSAACNAAHAPAPVPLSPPMLGKKVPGPGDRGARDAEHPWGLPLHSLPTPGTLLGTDPVPTGTVWWGEQHVPLPSTSIPSCKHPRGLHQCHPRLSTRPSRLPHPVFTLCRTPLSGGWH